jgi:hypothetical protein
MQKWEYMHLILTASYEVIETQTVKMKRQVSKAVPSGKTGLQGILSPHNFITVEEEYEQTATVNREADAVFAELGEQGWEMVGIVGTIASAWMAGPLSDVHTSGYRVIFKRPKP